MNKKTSQNKPVKSEVATKISLRTKTLLVIAMMATIFVGYSFAGLAVKNVAGMAKNSLQSSKAPSIGNDNRQELREQLANHFVRTFEAEDNVWIGAVSPVAYDLNGDGKKELILQTTNRINFADDSSKLYILDYKGIILHEINVNCLLDSRGIPTIVLIDNIPYIGAYCVRDNSKSFLLYNNEGILFRDIEMNNTSLSDTLFGSVVAQDLNNDGQVELVFGGWSHLEPYLGSYLYAIDLDGNNIDGFPVLLEDMQFSQTNTPVVANLNNTDDKEIIISSISAGQDNSWGTIDDTANIRAYSNSGNQLWSYDLLAKSDADPAFYDFNNDGFDEIVVTYRNGFVILDELGNVLQDIIMGNNMLHSNPSIADMNNDGQAEIIFGYGSNLYVYNFAGVQLLNYSNATVGSNTIAIGDIDGNGANDIIFNSYNSHYLKAINLDGESLPIFPLILGANIVGYSSPTVIDINGDQKLDLITSTSFNENGDPSTVGKLHIWHLQNSTQSPSPWPMYQHDAQHTGNYTEVPLCRNNVLELGEECEHGVQACGLVGDRCSNACECKNMYSDIKPFID